MKYVFVLCLVVFFSKVHAAAQTVNLSRTFFEGAGFENMASVANEFEFTADGTQLVFSADFDEDGLFELYAVNVDGSRPRLLSTQGLQMEDDNDFRLAPNGNYLTFRSVGDAVSSIDRFFAVSLLSDNPVAIDLVASDLSDPDRRISIGAGTISNDSRYIVVTTRSATPSFVFLPNGEVGFAGDNRFFVIDVGGFIGSQVPAPFQFHSHESGFGPESGVSFFAPNGEFLVPYSVSSSSGVGGTASELFRLSLDGSSAVQLSDHGGAPFIVDFSPDGQFVLYRELFSSNLFISRLNQTDSTQLNMEGRPVVSINVPGVPSFTPDGRFIAFDMLEQDAELDSVAPGTQSSKALVRNPFLPGGQAETERVAFETPNAFNIQVMVFTNNDDSYYLAGNSQQVSLFNGAGRAGFIPQTPDFSFIRRHMHSDDGNTSVIVAAPQAMGGTDQVYIHDRRKAGELVRITDTQQTNQFLQTNTIDLSPDGSFVIVSMSDESGFSFNNLQGGIISEILIRVFGSNENVDLTPPLVDGGHILSLKISPDSRSLAYTADQDRDGLLELYSINLSNVLDINDELCFPVIGKSERITMVCL